METGDDGTRERVIQLRTEGHSIRDIAAATGLGKSTVQRILKRAGIPSPTAQDPAVDTCGRAREGFGDAGLAFGEDGTQGRDALSALTRENAAAELLNYIRISKEGVERARKAKEREAKRTDEDAERRRSQKAWEEVQFLKLYRDGLKIAVECTGLSKEISDPVTVSPVDAFLMASLDALMKDREEGIPFTKFPQSYEEAIAWEQGRSA